jgi:magnesium-transporting ATPase (P-type)
MATPARVDDAAITDAHEVARVLRTDLERGLTSEEAARGIADDGPNELRAAPPIPLWRRILAQFQDPLVYLLLGAIAVSLIAWGVEGRTGWPVDAIVIAIVVVINAVLGYAQEAKASSAVAALAHMTAVTSAVMRDAQVKRVPSAELVRGDVLILGEGDSVGADARLVQSATLRVQEASLTGESEAVLKDAATLTQPAALGDRLDMVFKGTAVAQGTGRAIVTATGMHTEIGAIAEMLEATKEEPTPLEKEITRIGRMLGIAVVIIAAAVVGTVLLISEIRSAADVIHVLLLGVSLAVAAVPEGLPAILSVVLALGVQRMAKRNAIVKNLSSVETLGSASVIASDKTGTLTRSEMTIERVLTATGGTHVTGVGYTPHGRVEHEGTPLTAGPLHHENVAVLSGGSLAGNAELREGHERGVGDPRRSDRSGVPGRRAQAGHYGAARAAFRAHRRNPVYVRAQDDVHDRARPRTQRRNRGDHEGRAGCAARTMHPRPRRLRGRRARSRTARADSRRRPRAVRCGAAHPRRGVPALEPRRGPASDGIART